MQSNHKWPKLMGPTVALKGLKLDIIIVAAGMDFARVYKVSKIQGGQDSDDPRGTNTVLFASSFQTGFLLILKMGTRVIGSSR